MVVSSTGAWHGCILVGRVRVVVAPVFVPADTAGDGAERPIERKRTIQIVVSKAASHHAFEAFTVLVVLAVVMCWRSRRRNCGQKARASRWEDRRARGGTGGRILGWCHRGVECGAKSRMGGRGALCRRLRGPRRAAGWGNRALCRTGCWIRCRAHCRADITRGYLVYLKALP